MDIVIREESGIPPWPEGAGYPTAVFMNKETLLVTDKHLKLLKRMYVGWNTAYFGAPEIDPKRPYGNSDIYDDINEVAEFGYSHEDWENYTDEQYQIMDKLHADMEYCLQILINNLSIDEGWYEQVDYFLWRKK